MVSFLNCIHIQYTYKYCLLTKRCSFLNFNTCKTKDGLKVKRNDSVNNDHGTFRCWAMFYLSSWLSNMLILLFYSKHRCNCKQKITVYNNSYQNIIKSDGFAFPTRCGECGWKLKDMESNWKIIIYLLYDLFLIVVKASEIVL